MFDSIRGVICFKISSEEPEKIINIIRNSYISCRNLRILHNDIFGQVYRNDYEVLKEFAENNKAEIIQTEQKGIIFALNKYKKRIGFLLGILLGLALIIFLSNIVMVIEISGNEKVSDEQIIAILEDNDIYIGSFIPNIDFRQAEKRIIVVLDDLAWIGIRNTGCRVTVEVNEITPVPEMVPTNRPCNVVATKDAQIVYVNVYMGRLIPLVGDGVKKGDLLISGVVKGKFDNTYYVHSMGDITGKYKEKVTFSQPLNDEITVFEDEIVKKSISFFGFRVPLYLNKKVEGEYEYTENINNIQLLKLTLPIGIVFSEYRPYTSEKIEYTNDMAEEILRDKVKRYEQNFLSDGDLTVLDKKEHLSIKNGVMTITVEYTIEGNITESQEIYVKR